MSSFHLKSYIVLVSIVLIRYIFLNKVMVNQITKISFQPRTTSCAGLNGNMEATGDMSILWLCK